VVVVDFDLPFKLEIVTEAVVDLVFLLLLFDAVMEPVEELLSVNPVAAVMP
jgi:hypothetical protein